MWKRAWTDTLPGLGLHNWRNLIRSIGLVITALLIVRLVGGQAQMSEEFVWIISTLAAIVVVFLITFLFHLIRAPVYIKWEKEKEKRLVVSLCDNYEPGDGSHWLRLRVGNPSLMPVDKCYGKVVSYTMLVKHDGETLRVADVPTGSSLNAHLPPERHPFPWASTTLPDVLTNISTRGYEFLYLVVVQDNNTYFFTPTDMGLRYQKVNITAEYELIIDIGSDVESFSPTRVRLVYEMTQRNIKAKSLDIIDLPSPDKATSQRQ